MVFKLDETLDSLLERIEVNDKPISGVIPIDRADIGYTELGYNVWPILRMEFIKHYPAEFEVSNRLKANLGILRAELVEKTERRNSPFVSAFRERFSQGIDTDRMFRREWIETIGRTVSRAIYLNYASEYKNPNDQSEGINLTRYYGKKGHVFAIRGQEFGADVWSTIENYIGNGSESHDNALILTLEGLKDSRMVVSFNKPQNETYLMYVCENIVH